MSHARRRLLLALKTAVAVGLIAAVGWQFAKLLRSPELADHEFRVRWPYLLWAGLLYLAAHALWGTFWVQLLRSQNARLPWLVGVRAYFISQIGKYVPGKAWVILLRVGMLRGRGLSPAVVGVTATYETLTSMAAGAVVGVALLPWAGQDFELVSVKGFALLGLTLLPLALVVLTVAAKRVGRKRAAGLPRPPIWLLAQGILQAMVGWAVLGLSLWCVVAGLSAEVPELTADVYLRHAAVAAVAYVIGFVVLVSPGGVGPREWAIQQAFGGSVGVVIALGLRLVWTTFEAIAAGVLYFAVRINTNPIQHEHDAEPTLHTPLPAGERASSRSERG